MLRLTLAPTCSALRSWPRRARCLLLAQQVPQRPVNWDTETTGRVELPTPPWARRPRSLDLSIYAYACFIMRVSSCAFIGPCHCHQTDLPIRRRAFPRYLHSCFAFLNLVTKLTMPQIHIVYTYDTRISIFFSSLSPDISNDILTIQRYRLNKQLKTLVFCIFLYTFVYLSRRDGGQDGGFLRRNFAPRHRDT